MLGQSQLRPSPTMNPHLFMLTIVPTAIWVPLDHICEKSVVGCSFKCGLDPSCQGFEWQGSSGRHGKLVDPGSTKIDMLEMSTVLLSPAEVEKVQGIIKKQWPLHFEQDEVIVGNDKFVFSTDKFNHSDASRLCSNFGGILAHPYNEDQWNAVASKIISGNDLILGLTYNPPWDGNYSNVPAIWSDNTPFVYQDYFNCMRMSNPNLPTYLRITTGWSECSEHVFMDDTELFREFGCICQF